MTSKIEIFLLFFSYTSISATSSTCPTGFTLLTNGKCVKYSSGVTTTHINAMANCQAFGGDTKLVSVSNAIDNTAILQLTTGAIWLGLKCSGTNYCVWEDGTAFTYSNFITGQPSTNIGNCVMMLSNGRWSSADCEAYSLNYVCQQNSQTSSGCSLKSYVSGDQGTLTSPNFPGSYIGTQDQQCNFIITSSSTWNQVQMAVQFPILQLDTGSDISIYNSESDSLPSVVLTSKSTADGTWYYSTGSTIRVQFNKCTGTCDSSQVHLWELNYRASNLVPTTQNPISNGGCNAGTLNAPGVIYSPNYPSLYPNNLDCSYYLVAPQGYGIEILFLTIDTEHCCDIIVIHDGQTTELGRLSGYYQPNTQSFKSTTNSMLVTFSTDSSGQKSGFQARFSVYQFKKSNRPNARKHCEELGGSLVTIRNSIDNSAILQFLSNSSSGIWLGLTCHTNKSPEKCTWDSDGSAASYNNFLPGYPVTNIGSCVYFDPPNQPLKGKWISATCDVEELLYLCE
ncbi:unnamed protein product [Caenorhabditis angaria]|uniref:Uncharacterized protein n=1 Tax=Caenorhabditis angaria TaxID=860376 RepID=A0A9P1ISK4_9PELO|nr:unnamed protein product [Caenorhabditis angaria]